MKYYRVKQDTFMWKEGAILSHNPQEDKGYVAIEDVWNAVPTIGEEYISSRIIEDPANSGWFERVYPDTLMGKIFHTKDQLVNLYNKSFKGA